MTDRAWPTAPKYPVRVISLDEAHSVDPIYNVSIDPGHLTGISVVTVLEDVHPEAAALMTGLPANRFTPPITELPAQIAALPEEEQGPALVKAIHDRKKASS